MVGGLIMKPFNLNEYLKNPSRKIVTRDGRSVRIVCTDREKEYYPIIALIKTPYGETTIACTKDGEHEFGSESKWDIFFATEKHEGYVNIFANPDGSNSLWDSRIYKSKEDAEDAGKGWAMYKSSVKIEWEE